MLCASSPISASTDMRDRFSVNRLFKPSVINRQLPSPFLALDIMRLKNYNHIQQQEIVAEAGTVIVEIVLAGAADVTDPSQTRRKLKKNDVLWVMAGAGAEYTLTPTTLDFVSVRLTLAVSSALQSLPTQTALLDAVFLESYDPVQVVLGRYNNARSAFTFPSLVNYWAVKLKKGQQWIYEAPINHRLVWCALITGSLQAGSDRLQAEDVLHFNPANTTICFTAQEDTLFMLGSAQDYEHTFR